MREVISEIKDINTMKVFSSIAETNLDNIPNLVSSEQEKIQ
jgi:hypothetical protein